jgi:hypothetical protein
MISVVAREGDSVLVRIPVLEHDIDGPVRENAVITFTMYDPDDLVLADGVMGYSPQKGWSAIVDLPYVDRTQKVRLVAVAQYQGVQRTLESNFSLRNV